MVREFIAALLLSVVAQATPTVQHVQEREPDWGFVLRVEEYKAVANTNYGDTNGRDPFLPACAHTVDPRPANTPSPTLSDGANVAVSFIIGTDGRVYSVFTLNDADNSPNAQIVIRTVERWRFHPGTCNEVPVDSEGLVLFKR
jgi:hypothetical protein